MSSLWNQPLKWALLFAVTLGISSCYLSRLAMNYNSMVNSRRLIADLLDDPGTRVSLRQDFERLGSILEYARLQGLNTKGAYRYYIEHEGPVVSHAVHVAKADELSSKTWWFPIVGSVPYLGFFSRERRDAEARRWQAAGYDVHLTGVSAFSSLGWLEDPVFSSHLERSEAELAEMMFHELSHRSFWLPGKVKFSENLATYVEDVLTRSYLSSRKLQSALAAYRLRQADLQLFRAWLDDLRGELEGLYSQDYNRGEILELKSEIFARFTGRLRPRFAEIDYTQGAWNNARVLASALYAPQNSRFERAYNCVGRPIIGEFLAKLEARLGDLDPFVALDGLCGA